MSDVPYKAEDFKLKDKDGKEHTLKEYAGKWLVLYFYPKDDTPGCTAEACSFRDGRDELKEKANAEVVGVSADDMESHEKFVNHHDLNFTILSDPDMTVIKTYGAWGKKMYGREGILRQTFLIDPEGMVQKVYKRAIPIDHANKVLDDLLSLQKS